MTLAPQEIELHLCYAAPRARPVDAAAVKALAASIAEIGLLNPVTVRRVERSRNGQCDAYEIVAGHHRVKALRHLDRETIPAFVVELDDLRAELALIDENLCRNDLGPAERAAATARRKRIYVELHPETRRGGDRKSDQVANLATSNLKPPAERFTAATADAIGQSERSVQRDAQRGEALGEDALRVAHTSLDKGDELDALAKLAPSRRRALIDRAAAGEKVSAKVTLKKDQRADREQALAVKQQALPMLKAGAIVADPAWRFDVRSRETGLDRAADNHYPTMSIDAIKALNVASIAADDCVLFLWATAPMLPQALEVMAAWGFAYRSHVIWVKDRVGTGYWFRNKHELLLVGVRGDVPAPAMGTQWPSVIEAPVGKHSAKPDAFLELIERYFPSLPKIELNRRGPARKGWKAWGNEAEQAEAPDAPDAALADASGTPAWWNEAGRMRAGGARIFDIAARFGKSPSTVHHALGKMRAASSVPETLAAKRAP